MKFFKRAAATTQDVVGQELANVLPTLEKPWYRTRHLMLLNALLLVPLLSSSAVGYDGSMMNGLQTLTQRRSFFNNPAAPLLGTINAVYPVSKILGAFVIGLVALLIGPIIQAASQNLAMFIASRAFIGVATVFIAVPSPILVTELAYPTHRAKATALFNTFFYFGAIAAAWSTYATFKIQSTWAWRIPSALQAAIPSLQLLFVYWVPESPRWLVANGKVEQAREIFVRFHAGGQEDSALVEFEVNEIEASLEAERQLQAKVSWLTLLRTPGNRKRTLIAVVLGIFAQWNGISVVSYYLTLVLNTIGITTTAEQALINGLLQLFNFAAAVFAGALMVDRIGRRKLWLISTGGLCLSYAAWTALTSMFVNTRNEAAGRAVVAFIFIAYFFYDIAWTPLVQAYTVEIFPYTLRARGLTVTLTSTYVGLISAQLINPVALTSLGWKYYIVFCCILAGLFVVVYFLFPETRGRSLEQIAEIFDGKKTPAAPAEQVKTGSESTSVEQFENKVVQVKTQAV